MPIDEVAECISVDVLEFTEVIKDRESEVYKHYRKGVLETKISVRAAIIQMAENGSQTAQTQTLDFFKKLENDNY